MMSAFGFGVMGIGMVLMLAFWVVVIAGGVWLVLLLARSPQATTTAGRATGAPRSDHVSQSPMEILNVRYVQGEITREQFEEMRRDLAV